MRGLMRNGAAKMSENTFIVLFRGVGGKTQLPTKPLREALTEAGFGNVSTYIASGNVVLSSHLQADGVEARVTAIAKAKFGFSKAIMVVTREEWADLIAQNPFPEAVEQPTTLHAFALEGEPSPEAVAALTTKTAPTERVLVRGKVLYFHAPQGFGTSKLPPVIDKTLGVASTARNWNTVAKLAEIADAAASRCSSQNPP